MGRPKLLLPFRGRPLIAGVVEALRDGGAEQIVVVTAPGNEELRAWAREAGLTVAVNPDPERGMLSTIRVGIAALGGPAELARRGAALLVSPADLPNLRAETVSTLLRRMAETGAPIAVPVHRGRRGHPLAIASALILEIDALDPDVGLKQLRDRHEAELLEVETEDAGVVVDVDTPEDYERAKAMLDYKDLNHLAGTWSQEEAEEFQRTIKVLDFPLPFPIIIAHRGASGYRPEHTLAAYELAIDLGANFIEPDLVATKDGYLIARHENEISETTDVAERPEFASRRTVKRIDGRDVAGWFAEDLTLAEIRTLRAKERLPFRNQEYNGLFAVPTFEEVLELALRRSVGVYPETKHPTYFRSIGLPLEEPLLAILEAAGLRDRSALVYIQSFESGNLKELRKKTALPLIQLLESDGGPFDLAEIAGYADGIGPDKRLIVPADGAGRLQAPTSLVADAHLAGLLVHPWTFRSDRQFLAAEYAGDPQKEYDQFFSLGVDGVFSDFADTAVHARASYFWSDFK